MRKFNLRDTVWSIRNNKVVKWMVWKIVEIDGNGVKYEGEDIWEKVPENEVFATKQELLDSL